MATMTERLAFLISANADEAIRAFEKTGKSAEKELGKATSSIDKLGGNLTKFGAGAMAFAGVAGAALFSFAGDAEDAETQTRKLNNSIANSKSVSRDAGDRLIDLANSIEKVTTADGDAIIGAESLLVQFGYTEDQIKTMTPLIVDLSKKMGIDMDTAARAVGKAAEGSTGQLKKMGIVVDESKTGGDAFKATMDALAGTVGGFARSEAETFSGKIEQLKVSLENLREGIGSGVIDVFSGAITGATNLSTKLGEIDPQLQNSAGRIMGLGTAALGIAGALSFAAGQAIKFKDRFTDSEGALNNFGKAAKYAGIMLATVAATDAVFGALNSVSDASGKAERALQQFDISMGDASSSTGELTKAFADMVKVQDDTLKFSHIWSDFGDEIAVGGYGAKRNIEDIDAAFKNVLDRGPAAAQALLDDWRASTEALDHNSSAYKDNIAELNKYQGWVDLAAGSQAALTGAQKDGTAAAQDGADALDDESDAAKELRDAFKEVEGALNDKLDAERASIDSSFAYRDSQFEVTDALAKFDEVMGDSNSTMRDAVEAHDEVMKAALGQADAALKLAEDQAEASGKVLTATERQMILRDELEKVAATLAPDSPLRRDILAYAEQIDEVPTYHETTFRANSEEAQAEIDYLLKRLDNLRYAGYINIGGSALAREKEGGIPPRAAGGPVNSGDAYLVGENGPELFVPGASGTIVPNSGGNPTVAAGNGATYNIDVRVEAGGDPATVGEKIVAAIRAHERRNGKGWRS